MDAIIPAGNLPATTDNAKIVAGILILGIAIAAGYYYFVYEPEQLTPERKFSRVMSIIKEGEDNG